MSSQPKRPSIPQMPRRSSSSTFSSVRPSNVRDANAEAYALGGGAIARPSAIASTAAKKTIMLVGPDASLRSRLRDLLVEHYDIIEAQDGMEAIEMTATYPMLSMIVSDTAMPRVDGFTMAKHLRANPVMKRVPIMFVSAQNSAQDVTQALVIGVSQYLPKTTPVSQIVEKIRKIVL